MKRPNAGHERASERRARLGRERGHVRFGEFKFRAARQGLRQGFEAQDHEKKRARQASLFSAAIKKDLFIKYI